MVESASAQSIPKPSVPEFTLKYVDNSYDVPPTYGVDPYTGKNALTQDGFKAQNKSIEMSISNLPFTPYKDSKGNMLQLIYEVRWKAHFSSDWGGFWLNYRLATNSRFIGATETLEFPNAPVTVFAFGFKGNNGTIPFYGTMSISDIPNEGQEDFQVQAYIGYYGSFSSTDIYGRSNDYYAWVTGETSGWSNIETITMPKGSVSTSTSPIPTATSTQNPTPTPVPEFPILVILPLVLAISLISTMLLRGKQRFPKAYN
jgi:hypothetical protein